MNKILIKEGIAKGQFRRLRRIRSEQQDYWKYGKVVEEKLIARGYGKNQVRQQMKETTKMSRKDALERVGKKTDRRINFVLTHSGHLPNVNKILERHGHYLAEDGMGRYMEELPRLSLRRGRNLGDLIVNAKQRVESGGSGPCGKGCMLCKHMKVTDKVKDKDGRDMVLEKMDCRTVGAVNGMYCKPCGKMVYVGKTKSRLMSDMGITGLWQKKRGN